MEEYKISEEDQRAMDDAFESLNSYHKECIRRNERLMRAVRSVMGHGFHDEVAQLFEECEVGGGMWYIQPHEIVKDCPEKENACDVEDWQYIKEYRVEQWSVVSGYGR